MSVEIFNQFGTLKFDEKKIIHDLDAVFNTTFSNSKQWNVILINEMTMQDMNKQYRNIDRPTDVLSFPDDDPSFLGDIFICIEKVHQQAEDYCHTLEREFAFLVVHGYLHLLGFDHKDIDDENAMIKKQTEILSKTSYSRSQI